MRRSATSLAALAAAVLLLAGCGSKSDTGAQGGKGGKGTDTGSAGKVSPSAPASGGCASAVDLKATDAGRTVCVAKGGEVRLTLEGTKSRPWKPVQASGTALKAINTGLVIRPGQATATYHAVAAGTEKLTSSRPMCAQPTKPGEVSCMGLQEWAVTVTVK
ncbi:hypothetical protein [Streptomyces monashensis]|uniref:DUF4232 domain-containing protein n=1 Tax=Streptomyces monashensis TaxID=1678012 RepID=A0A1S2Q0E2_9ACTN|nr:hypothetical protein [Streptomyces monashensis]OIJ99589.1 hypothetical protein BIV23_28370 [Streptomyces monashensis]